MRCGARRGARASASRIARPEALPAGRPWTGGGVALASRPAGRQRRVQAEFRARACAPASRPRDRDHVLSHRAGGPHQYRAPRAGERSLDYARRHGGGIAYGGARQRSGFRRRGRTTGGDGRQEHGPVEHGRARDARRRAACHRLGARAGDPVEPRVPSGPGERGTNMTPVRVLLADDHALVRAGIRALLEGLEGVAVVAEAGNGGEVLGLARKHRPDVVLLDISMPGIGGLEASAQPKQVVEGYVQRVGAEQPAADHLTPRQRQVLQLIAEGLSTKEIAYRLELSVKTVETHRAQLMERLQIRDIAGLVKYAIRNGLVSSEK